MISLQESIKYLALAIIIYCLIKAFADEKIDNKQIVILVVVIMIVVFFLVRMNTDSECPRKKKEFYSPTDPTDPPITNSIYNSPLVGSITPGPLVDSIYPGPPDKEEKLDKPENLDFEIPDGERDKDVEDLKDIMGIDKEVYEKLGQEEQEAMGKIVGRYRDEMVYTSTHPFNTVPLGTQLYGYTYLPPENWFRAYEKPPVCVTDRRCPVEPIYSGKDTVDLMEFDTSNNVLGPEGMDIRYIKKKINDNIQTKNMRGKGGPTMNRGNRKIPVTTN